MLYDFAHVFWLVLGLPALLAADVSASPSNQPLKLLPININHYEATMGLQRRDAEDYSSLSPQEKSQLIYGSAGGKYICVIQLQRRN